MNCAHTGVPKGKRVRVVLADGSRFVAKFSHHTSKRIHFLDHQDVMRRSLKSMTIVRIAPHGD